jgi:hypothetical protein
MSLPATTVRVAQKHIDKGTACNSARCPIALALHEALDAQGAEQVQGLFVDEHAVRFTHYDRAGGRQWRTYRADLDEQASDFIDRFDDGHTVQPFETVLTWTEVFR